MGDLGLKTRSHCSNMEKPCYHSRGHTFDSTVMKLGQDACLGNCSDEFDGSGERSRAILALLFTILADIRILLEGKHCSKTTLMFIFFIYSVTTILEVRQSRCSNLLLDNYL
jgi:hypothetical protein